MILSDISLKKLLPDLIRKTERDESLVNPASIDIRVGDTMLAEDGPGMWRKVDLSVRTYLLKPKEFALVSVYEWITVPNGYAVELKLKSSRAREGYNHSLAFYVDPGWVGILTMEISNVTRYTELPLFRGLKIGQIIVHTLDQHAENPYSGRYNHATQVEAVR